MPDKVIIKESVHGKGVKIWINEERLNDNTRLAGIARLNFEEYYTKIMTEIDRFFGGDSYELDCYMQRFPFEILQKRCTELCTQMNWYEPEFIFSVEQIREAVMQICEKHGLKQKNRDKWSIYLEQGINRPAIQGCVIVDNEMDAEIGIYQNEANALQSSVGRILLIANADEKGNEISVRGRQYIYRIRQNQLFSALMYCKSQIEISEAEKELEILDRMKLSPKEEKEKLFLKSGEPSWYLGDIPRSIDPDEEIAIDFCSFPKEAYYLEGSNGIVINNNQIFAEKPGMGMILLKRSDGAVVWNREIEMISHHYAEKIEIFPQSIQMKNGTQEVVEIAVTPSDAEDIKQFEYSCAEGIASVVMNGLIGRVHAVGTGICYLSVSGKKTRAVCKIQILPSKLEKLELPAICKVGLNSWTSVECKVTPADWPETQLRWSFDKPDILRINANGKTCSITTFGLSGAGNLTCEEPESGISETCYVMVVEKPDREYRVQYRHGVPQLDKVKTPSEIFFGNGCVQAFIIVFLIFMFFVMIGSCG